ncbi:hypothetical protein GcC1_009031 [Golovinomyces cichoracearum]|uniref:Uncharacterized protein n=1 Tax=Golovinomyces cichoracearum TaxID=62708 RepID=A0A420J7W4_9PEZI|nr:hypothetical protein GcC1_009031 [Golovinomyces cichoracearum]
MDPPHSSSSISSSPTGFSNNGRDNSRNLRSSRNKTHSAEKDLNLNSSSPPSLTHSPDMPDKSTGRAKTRKQPLSPCSFSTAQLQSLLPRRRRRIGQDIQENTDSENEIDISELASDEDELTHLIVNPRSRKRSHRLSVTAPNRSSVSNRKFASKSREVPNNLRTYGPRRSIQSDPSNNIEIGSHTVPSIEHDKLSETNLKSQRINSKELKKAAQKFHEVDKWELEFEDATGSSASPRDAR